MKFQLETLLDSIRSLNLTFSPLFQKIPNPQHKKRYSKKTSMLPLKIFLIHAQLDVSGDSRLRLFFRHPSQIECKSTIVSSLPESTLATTTTSVRFLRRFRRPEGKKRSLFRGVTVTRFKLHYEDGVRKAAAEIYRFH